MQLYDYYLVKLKIKLKLKKKKRREDTTLDNYNISKLGNKIFSDSFKDELCNQIGRINVSIMDTVEYS